MVRLIKDYPAIGWVKAENITTSDEILKLKNKIEELENELKGTSLKVPDDTELLSRGSDKLIMHFTYSIIKDMEFSFNHTEMSSELETTWNDVFYFISPSMINEIGERFFKTKMNEYVKSLEETKMEEKNGKKCVSFEINQVDFDTIKVQFKALGMITKNIKQRSVRDGQTYWTLTPYGDAVMTKMRAIKKTDF
jgi:hypothetical protein